MVASSKPRGPVAVTGAGGFIGRRVVAEVLRTTEARVRMLLMPGERLPASWLTRDELGGHCRSPDADGCDTK